MNNLNINENIGTELFRFKFTSINNGAHKQNKIYTVYSYNREMMDMFLIQHSFSINDIYVDHGVFYDKNIFENILKPYMFKSNKSKNIYNIITTSSFVADAVSCVGSELSASLMFGPPAIRGDIEIFNLISDLIDKLPHVYILEQNLLCDDNYLNDYNYNKEWTTTDEFSLDDSGLYESLIEASTNSEIQPITLEAYVEFFSILLTK